MRTAIEMAPALRRSNTMRRMWAYSGPEQVRPQEPENLGEPESRAHILSRLSWPRGEEDTGSVGVL